MVKQLLTVPDGFIEIQDLEQYESEQEVDLEDGWADIVGEVDIRPTVPAHYWIADSILSADGVYEFVWTRTTVRHEVDVQPDFPTELASGYDWLTRIDDNGLKQALHTIHRVFGGFVQIISDSGMGEGHVPAAHPSDRYTGQQWRCAPIVDWHHRPVCGTCHIVLAYNGACFC